MTKVGIVANPFASMDIRRLVAQASTMGSYHKIGIVRRVISALNWAGVDEILIMPDRDHLGRRAVGDMHRDQIKSRITILEMPITNEAEDSLNAVRLMREAGVGCLVTMGGDGTNRIVARVSGDVPLMPISTGTNNTFPFMVEGTTAGLAAGIVARNIVPPEKSLTTVKNLDIIKNGEAVDLALIDAVVLDQQFVGARAIWDIAQVREVVTTQCHPAYIGMASIGGAIHPIDAADDLGIAIKIGDGALRVSAAIAPGGNAEVPIASYRLLQLDDRVEVKVERMSIIALDGEREVEIQPTDKVEIALRRDGPRVIKIHETLEAATRAGFFTLSGSC